jgi:hypothetical protein
VNQGATDVRCHAVRRLNPLEGVLQIVETNNARAYSPDGMIWQIQVLTRRPDHTWRSFSHVLPIEQFFNFGLWDAEGGLQKIPANPVMDIGGMTRAAEALSSQLRRLTGQLPFRLSDRYECWSTDYQGNPIALLATTEAPERMLDIRAARWQATRISDHGFVSPSLAARGIPAAGELGPRLAGPPPVDVADDRRSAEALARNPCLPPGSRTRRRVPPDSTRHRSRTDRGGARRGQVETRRDLS